MKLNYRVNCYVDGKLELCIRRPTLNKAMKAGDGIFQKGEYTYIELVSPIGIFLKGWEKE